MEAQLAATAKTEPTDVFADINGLRLHWLDWGGNRSEPVILLLHGGAAHAHWWDYVAPQLTQLGRVVALDFRGHGQSQWTRPADYGPPAYVEDTVGVIRHLNSGAVVLAGHSMGGAVSQWVATQHPELLRALVLLDSPAGPPPFWVRMRWRWRRRSHGGTRPELESRQQLIAKFRLSPPGTYLSKQQLLQLASHGIEQLPNGRWAYRFDPETRAWRRMRRQRGRPPLGKIVTPTLILRGAESELVSAPRASSMHRRIRGSVYQEIARAFHHVPLDNPDDTARAISEFVSALG